MRKRRYEEPRMTAVEVKTEALICSSPLSVSKEEMGIEDEFE